MSRVSFDAMQSALMHTAQKLEADAFSAGFDLTQLDDLQLGHAAGHYAEVLSIQTEGELGLGRQSVPSEMLRLNGLLEDGLHVLYYGLAQVVRQSRAAHINSSAIVASVNGAREVFRYISGQALGPAVDLENILGFRGETYANPAKRLHINGSSVIIPESILPTGIKEPEQGCPFRSQLLEAYPDLSKSFLHYIGVPTTVESVR